MPKYLDLAELKTKTITADEEMIIKGLQIGFSRDCPISKLSLSIKEAVKNTVADLSADKTYNFVFDMCSNINEEEFETVVNVILAAFFEIITGQLRFGRNRERRLDVPEELKTSVNCSMSLLKRAINYRTVVDKFQLVVNCGEFHYVLVGEDYE